MIVKFVWLCDSKYENSSDNIDDAVLEEIYEKDTIQECLTESAKNVEWDDSIAFNPSAISSLEEVTRDLSTISIEHYSIDSGEYVFSQDVTDKWEVFFYQQCELYH